MEDTPIDEWADGVAFSKPVTRTRETIEIVRMISGGERVAYDGLTGDRDAARRAVPTEIGLRTNLIGPLDEVRRRLREYRDSGVGTLRVNPIGNTLDAQLDGLGRLNELLHDVNEEASD